MRMRIVLKTMPALFGALAICCNGLSEEAASADDKPNILVIVSDDQGYADAGFQGSKKILTPHLDRLARSGIRCTSGYVSHPFCSPSRAGLPTGRYQQRFGHYYNPVYDPLDEKEGLPLAEQLLPHYLREASWKTGWIGKWHLGASPSHAPRQRGFEETFGFIGGGHRYRNWKPDGRQYTLPLERDGAPVEVAEHLTTAFGDEAAAFIRRHQDQPWFLYVAFNAPHTPHEPTLERAGRFVAIGDVNRRNYAAQVSLLDDAVGKITAALAASGQQNRTLAFFFSDNGGPEYNGALNAPLRGGKGEVYEGGIRVPFIVSWPGVLPARKDYNQPVSSLDVFATALAQANIPASSDMRCDGVNLIPFLAGELNRPPHKRLFWRVGGGNNPNLAVREDDWKLVCNGTQPAELYDLAADIGETTNLAAERPEIVAQLVAVLETWNKELSMPAFLGSSVKSEDWGPGGANQAGIPPRKKGIP